MKVNKSNYEVHQFNGGYFGIIEKGTTPGSSVVFGGDSADEDCHDEYFINEVYQKWDGELNEDGVIEVNF